MQTRQGGHLNTSLLAWAGLLALLLVGQAPGGQTGWGEQASYCTAEKYLRDLFICVQ